MESNAKLTIPNDIWNQEILPLVQAPISEVKLVIDEVLINERTRKGWERTIYFTLFTTTKFPCGTTLPTEQYFTITKSREGLFFNDNQKYSLKDDVLEYFLEYFDYEGGDTFGKITFKGYIHGLIWDIYGVLRDNDTKDKIIEGVLALKSPIKIIKK